MEFTETLIRAGLQGGEEKSLLIFFNDAAT